MTSSVNLTMAESIRQPDELVLAGNIAENWRKFKQEFELYMLAAGHDTKPPKQKIALLLHVARKQAAMMELLSAKVCVLLGSYKNNNITLKCGSSLPRSF